MAALKELTQADLYHVFAIDRRGDTLIIAPRGDATSFPEHHFRAAANALRRRLDGNRPCRLIVDLSHLAYPGLAMLDTLDDLIGSMHWRGETVVVAGASPETLRVLQEYGLGREWVHHPSLAAAIRSVVHEPVWSRLRRHVGPVLAASLIVLFGSGLTFTILTRPHADRVAYDETLLLWNEYQTLRKKAVDDPDLITAVASIAEQTNGLAERVVARGSAPEIVAAVEQLQIMLDDPQIADESRDRELAIKIVAARNVLDASQR